MRLVVSAKWTAAKGVLSSLEDESQAHPPLPIPTDLIGTKRTPQWSSEKTAPLLIIRSYFSLSLLWGWLWGCEWVGVGVDVNKNHPYPIKRRRFYCEADRTISHYFVVSERFRALSHFSASDRSVFHAVFRYTWNYMDFMETGKWRNNQWFFFFNTEHFGWNNIEIKLKTKVKWVLSKAFEYSTLTAKSTIWSKYARSKQLVEGWRWGQDAEKGPLLTDPHPIQIHTLKKGKLDLIHLHCFS